MKAIFIAFTAIVLSLMTVPTAVHAQTNQACPQIPPGCPGYVAPAPPVVQPTPPAPIPQFIPQQIPQAVPVAPAPSGITLKNITDAITAAVDPINKHLTIIDGQIVNITTAIKKLQTTPAPIPPPTNSTTPLPPPAPPGQGSGPGGGSCPNSFPSGFGPSGPGEFFPGGGGFYPGGPGMFFPGGFHEHHEGMGGGGHFH